MAEDRRLVMAGMLLLLTGPAVAAETFPEAHARSYIDTYCISCHGPEVQKADLRLDRLGTPVGDASASLHWSDVLDRITAGDMPPAKAKAHPKPEERQAMLAWLRGLLREAEHGAVARGGRVVMRRLNRIEYQNTVRDLLGLGDRFNVVDELPVDNKVDGFDTVGSVLVMSPAHLERFLHAAEDALEVAFDPRSQRPAAELWRFDSFTQRPVQEGSSLRRKNDEKVYWLVGDDGSLSYPDAPSRERGAPQRHPPVPDPGGNRKRERQFRWDNHSGGSPLDAGSWGELEHHVDRKGEGGSISCGLQSFQAREAGRYRIRARVRADWDPHAVGWFSPRFQCKISPTGNTTYIDHAFRRPGQAEIAEGWITLEAGQRADLRFGTAFHNNTGLEPPKGTDHTQVDVLLDWVEIEGPLFDFPGWPSPVQRHYLGDWTDLTEAPGTAQLRGILERFIGTAFRRPPAPEEIAWRERFVASQLASGTPPLEAVRTALASVMTSTSFLYLVEPRSGDARRPLTAWELASRLSYFLWGTMPDERLRELAASGELTEVSTLAAEARRLMADARIGHFTTRFPALWLDLARFDAAAPDTVIYPDWSPELRDDLHTEATAFFAEIFHSSRPTSQFLASDFLMLNRRLASHYHLPSLPGHRLRPVPNRPEFQRSGLMTLGAVLTLTSNSVRTSPVHRGVYLLERVFDDPPPPPDPNAGVIDNAVPGADKISVRERLALHRKVESCAECHIKIDPPGFALENYNAIGRYRVREYSGEPGNPDQIGAAVDASGQTPTGKPFKDLAGFLTLVREQEAAFQRGLVKKLMLFALGRPAEIGDRSLVESLAAELEAEGSLPELVLGLVQSDTFRSE